MSRTKNTRVVSEETTTVVDEDGVVKQQSRVIRQVRKSEPPYIKTYLEDICYLNNISHYCHNVLRAMMSIASVTYADTGEEQEQGMIINLTPYMRQLVMQKLGLKSTQSVSNAITQLVQGEVLFRLGSGSYRLNPYLFGMGDWNDIAKLRLTVDYDFLKQRKVMNAKIEKNPPQEDIDLSHDTSVTRSPIKLPPEEKRLLELMFS